MAKRRLEVSDHVPRRPGGRGGLRLDVHSSMPVLVTGGGGAVVLSPFLVASARVL